MAKNTQLIKSALYKSAPELYKAIDGEYYGSQTQVRGARRSLFRLTASGDSAAKLSEQMRKMLNAKNSGDAKLDEFNMNYTPIVIDKEASRVHIDNIDLGNDAANEWLADRLDESRFDAIEGMSYRGALLDGDSYIIIDPRRVVMRIAPAYDGYNGVSVIYDENGHVQWACELWSEGSGESVFETDSDNEDYSQTQKISIITYYQNKIQSWKGTLNGSEVVPYAYLNDGVDTEATWLLDRLPIIPFVNKKDNYSYFGESEIKPAIPIQNVINQLLKSTVMSSELAGFVTNLVIGADIDPGPVVPGSWISVVMKDANGDPITSMSEDEARVLQNIKVQQIEPAPLQPYLDALDKFVLHLMQVTQTPIYGINMSGNISGEALKQLEIGLIGKVERFQRENTDAWKEAVQMLHDVQKTFRTEPNLGNPPQFDTINIKWKSAEIRDKNAEIDMLVKMRKDAPDLMPDSFYRDQILGKLGYDAAEIARITEEIDAQKVTEIESLFGGNNPTGLVV